MSPRGTTPHPKQVAPDCREEERLMGFFRKVTSVSTLGLVDFRSDKERTAAYTKRSAKEARKQTALQTAQLEHAKAQSAASTPRRGLHPAGINRRTIRRASHGGGMGPIGDRTRKADRLPTNRHRRHHGLHARPSRRTGTETPVGGSTTGTGMVPVGLSRSPTTATTPLLPIQSGRNDARTVQRQRCPPRRLASRIA